MEGLQWMNVIAFPLKQSQVRSSLALKQLFVFLMLWVLLFSLLCCSLAWGQADKARDNSEPRTRHKEWVACDPLVPCKCCGCSRLWLPGHIWKWSWMEQCLNDAWEKGGNKTATPVWFFRDIVFWKDSCLSQRMFFIHIVFLNSLGNMYTCVREGEKQVVWDCWCADVYKVKKVQPGALDQGYFETGKLLPFVQLLGV